MSHSSSPPDAGSFTLIVDDADAAVRTWLHRMIFNIHGDANVLPEGVPEDHKLADGSRLGRNEQTRIIGYGGPRPLSGSTRGHVFELQALDNALDLGATARKETLVEAVEGHIFDEARLIGDAWARVTGPRREQAAPGQTLSVYVVERLRIHSIAGFRGCS